MDYPKFRKIMYEWIDTPEGFDRRKLESMVNDIYMLFEDTNFTETDVERQGLIATRTITDSYKEGRSHQYRSAVEDIVKSFAAAQENARIKIDD